MQDKIITCKDCGTEFTFTKEEQAFYAEKGFTNEPQRCKQCRNARKNGGSTNERRTMYKATCSSCGREANVPFKPRDDRPVYCSDCFTRSR